MNHIILAPCDEKKIFCYFDRTIHRTDANGKVHDITKLCDEIHFIVTYEVTCGGRTIVQKKAMPTLPLITGGGKQRSSWTIENMLKKGAIIGMEETPLKAIQE